MDDCVFCKIVKSEIPSNKIWEDKKHLAILSIFPNTPGFTVVLPKKHYSSYAFEADDKVLTDLVLATKKVARILDEAFDDVGRTGMFFEGYGIDHLHSKLSPMHGTALVKGWVPIETKKNMTFFKKYPGYLSSHDAAKMNEVELRRLTNKIKKAAKKIR